jgi:crotonobetainyl-CoA:carnitine CoA-transferase CaiB-like acyl-CoA transferase
MTRPFEGIRIIDVTHVLAGPFAAYQLAVLGAAVIKVEHPDEPDQTRDSGTDRELNRRGMGTSYLTQSSNKRSITLDLKSEAGRDILKRSCSAPTSWSRTTGRAPSPRSVSATK